MEEKIKQYTRDGFTKTQAEEIVEGLEAGLDVSIYADKKFLAVQMRQIRLGLMEGLDVKQYASEKFDWFQMEEIRQGLLEGAQVSKYARPEISFEKMRQVRKGFQVGLDLSKYLQLDAGMLREIRKALQEKVNIVEFIREGYDAEQLVPIRLALEEGLDIRPYLLKDYRGVAIEEIRHGLQKGLDVSVYADVRLSWLQMRQIRLGLENRVDVSYYNNPLYSWQQMKEIRLGLENSVDVSQYSSFMYTAKEMEKRRIELEDSMPREKEDELAEIFKPEIETQNKFKDFKLRISEDELEAYIEVAKNVEKIRRDELDCALKMNQIIRGIDYDMIVNLTKGAFTERELKIAEGKLPENGEDGWYEYFFRTQMNAAPKLLEDGSVDYRKIEWFEVVKEGQKIAYYHEAQEGTPGWTITGKRILAKKGKEKSVLEGTGFKALQDGKTYVATMSGRIEMTDERIEISKMLVVDDVTLASGNVQFDGSLYVRGDVGTGVKIEVTEDLVVDGFVEGAVIECGGNILFRKGVNADNQGYIRAKGDVTGKFFEDTSVYADGNISASYCLNSLLKAERKIIVSGRRGTIAGGRAFAMRGIEADNLGNKAGLPTIIKLGIDETVANRQHNIEEAIASVSEELNSLKKAQRELCKKFSAEQRNSMDVFMKVEKAVYTEREKLRRLEKQKESIDEEIKEIRSVKVVIKGRAYEGVVLDMNGCKWHAQNNFNVNVRSREGRIIVCGN